MTIWETGIAIGVMLLLLAGYFATQSEILDADEARLRATAIERLHAGVEAYLRNDYAFLEQCLDGPGFEKRWNRSGAGGQAGPFKAVRLYPTPLKDMPVGNHAQALTGTEDELDCVNPALGAPRSLSEAGFLPAMLAGRRYDTSEDSSNLWRGLDFRLLIRMVNLTREGADLRATPPIAAHVGLQALLAMQARSGEAMSERDAGAVLRTMAIGEGGIVRSINVSDTVREQTIAGRNGGWRMELCSLDGVAGLNACELPIKFHQHIHVSSMDSPERRAFLSDTGGDPTTRVVTVTSVGREEGLREVLHRADIGIPEANRMETDIDMGAYGLLNVAYVTGIDEDGDGLIDRGFGLIGPQRHEDPDTDGRRAHPVTVYGDLHVRGAIHVGAGVDADGDGVPSEFDTSIPEGTVWAQGGIQVGTALDGDVPMGFDEALPDGGILVPRGVQVGGSRFGIRLDDLELPPGMDAALASAMWARGSVQLGDVIVYDELDEPFLDSPHDPNVPPGALLVTGGRISEEMNEESVGELRSSGGLRVVGPEIMLAASNSLSPSRAGPRRGWNAVGSGLGDIRDPELKASDEYVRGTGGRIQFRSEGDELRMVTNSGSLRVMPRVVEGELDSVQLTAQLTDDLSLIERGDVPHADRNSLVVNSEEIWVEEVAGTRSLKSRTLHSALPQYVSKRFDWNQKWERDSSASGSWRIVDPDFGECRYNGDPNHVLIPVSWSRTDFANTATFNVNLQKWVIPQAPLIIPTPWIIPIVIPRFKVFWAPLPDSFMGSDTSQIPGAFTLNHPYLGWSIDPETGNDNTLEVPNEDAVGFTDFSRNIFCDYSVDPLERPSAEFSFVEPPP